MFGFVNMKHTLNWIWQPLITRMWKNLLATFNKMVEQLILQDIPYVFCKNCSITKSQSLNVVFKIFIPKLMILLPVMSQKYSVIKPLRSETWIKLESKHFKTLCNDTLSYSNYNMQHTLHSHCQFTVVYWFVILVYT